MENNLVLSTFIKQLDECFEEVSKQYDADTRFIKCRLYYDTMKKANPRLIITVWKSMVTDKYDKQISSGDIGYFLEKDYSEDVPDLYNSTVDSSIQELRIAVRGMSDENKGVTLKYFQNLCKLSKLYVY